MNPDGNFAYFNIKPIQLICKNLPNNWINSPKGNPPPRIIKSPNNPFQPRLNINNNIDTDKRQTDLHKQSTSLFMINNKNKNAIDDAYFKQFQLKGVNVSKAGNFDHKIFSKEKGKSGNKISYFENIPPNLIQYDHMHKKLNALEDKLALMKQKLFKRKQQRKNQAIQELKNFETQMKDKNKKQQLNMQVLQQVVSQVNCNKQLKSFSFNPYSQSNNIYYVSEILKSYKHENTLARDHLINSLNQLKVLAKIRGTCIQQLQKKQLKLVKKHLYQGKKTVVFDLDQTLIHCAEKIESPCDVKLQVKFPTGQIVQAGINIRPYATDILKNLSKNFEVIVFTASHSCYANQVLDHLDPKKEYISHRLFRQHCYHTAQGVYIKDLRVINRQLCETVLIDNAAYSYALQIDNGIPIIPYYEGKVDFELKALQKYLETLISCKDVRDINRNTFKLNKYIQFDNPQYLVKSLYVDLKI